MQFCPVSQILSSQNECLVQKERGTDCTVDLHDKGLFVLG
jgi:hypothetical protein